MSQTSAQQALFFKLNNHFKQICFPPDSPRDKKKEKLKSIGAWKLPQSKDKLLFYPNELMY